MLPPIHKPVAASSGGSANESTKRRGNALTETFEGATHHDRVEPENTGGGGRGSSHVLLAERLLGLERENQQIREELHHLRHVLSNNTHNQHQHQRALSESDELQRVVQALTVKSQADALWQQREQQKAALLFAEVARVGHALENVDHTVRILSDDTRRRLDHHDYQLTQLSVLSTAVGASRASPTKRSQDEYLHYADEIQWLKHALSQLRTELESDRTERWKVESDRSASAAELRAALTKTETLIDAKLAAQLERVHSKLVADKLEMVRTLDEFRGLTTGADFQRVSSQLLEFSRIHDHVHALERWLHSEHGKIKRVLQTQQTHHESRHHAVVSECAAMLRLLHSVVQQQDDDWRVQWGLLHNAVAEMAGHVQRKVFALEEVVPMEVQARQSHDDKLRQRVDSVVASLSRAMEATRQAVAVSESNRFALPDHTALAAAEAVGVLQQRVDALERSLLRRVDEHHEGANGDIANDAPSIVAQVPVKIPLQPCGGDTVAVSDRPAVETEVRIVDWEFSVRSNLLQPFVDELSARHNELLTRVETLESVDPSDAIMGLQRWSATHTHECRQCYEYLEWTLDETLRELAVRHTLDRLVDDVHWNAARGTGTY